MSNNGYISYFDWLGDWQDDRFGEHGEDGNNVESAGEFAGMSALEFVKDTLGEEPYGKQQDILRAVDSEARRVSVVGCNGSGKDWTAARVVLWWVRA